MRFALSCAAFAFTITGALAIASGDAWHRDGAPGTGEFNLTYGNPSSGDPAYLFDCSAPDQVAITQYAVIDLLDTNSGRRVDDTSPALADGAAFMGIATDVTQPRLVPASASRNRLTGWDLTIRLSKSDPAFTSLAKATRISLMTTGATIVVPIAREDLPRIRDFVGQCAASVVAASAPSATPAAKPLPVQKKPGRTKSRAVKKHKKH